MKKNYILALALFVGFQSFADQGTQLASTQKQASHYKLECSERENESSSPLLHFELVYQMLESGQLVVSSANYGLGDWVNDGADVEAFVVQTVTYDALSPILEKNTLTFSLTVDGVVSKISGQASFFIADATGAQEYVGSVYQLGSNQPSDIDCLETQVVVSSTVKADAQ